MEALEARFCPSITRTYDANWALTGVTESISGPAASTTNWNYNPYPTPIAITEAQNNPGGFTSNFAWHYDAGGSLETVTQNGAEPGGITTDVEWRYVNGTVATATETVTDGPDTTVTQWVYNNDGSIGSVTAQNTNTDGSASDFTWAYNADGSLASATEKTYYAGGAPELSETWTYSGGALSTFKEENYNVSGSVVDSEWVINPDASLVDYEWLPGPGGAPGMVSEFVYNPTGTEVAQYAWAYSANGSLFQFSQNNNSDATGKPTSFYGVLDNADGSPSSVSATTFNADGTSTQHTDQYNDNGPLAGISEIGSNAQGQESFLSAWEYSAGVLSGSSSTVYNPDRSYTTPSWAYAGNSTTLTSYFKDDYDASGNLLSSYSWMPGDPPPPAPSPAPSPLSVTVPTAPDLLAVPGSSSPGTLTGTNATHVLGPGTPPTGPGQPLAAPTVPAEGWTETTAPGPVVTGEPFDVAFSAKDADGSVDQNYNGDVTIGVTPNPGAPQLFGNPTVLANHGVADFTNLSIDVPGAGFTFTVTSRAASDINPAIGDPFAVADQLVVSTQPPANVTPLQPFKVVVKAVDGAGNLDPSFAGNVTIALDTGPAGAKLGGTLTVAAKAGVATFSDLTVDTAGSGYTLDADDGATSVDTKPFAAGFTPTLTVTDAGGPYDGQPLTATATATGVDGTPVNGTFTVTYYTGAGVTGAGSTTAPTHPGTYTVVASFTSSDPNYSNAQSAPVTFTIGPPLPGADLTPLVPVSPGTIKRQGSRFRQTLTLVNRSGMDLTGPLALVLNGLPRKVKVRSTTGGTVVRPPRGSPYVVIVPPGGTLRPGQTLTVTLTLTGPAGQRPQFTTRVVAGVS